MISKYKRFFRDNWFFIMKNHDQKPIISKISSIIGYLDLRATIRYNMEVMSHTEERVMKKKQVE